MGLEDPIPQYTHLISGLTQMKSAYLHMTEAMEPHADWNPLFQAWSPERPIILATGFDPKTAVQKAEQHKDHDVAIAFAKHFTSNPDLAFRIREGIPLTPWNPAHLYSSSEREGYTEYEFCKAFSESRL